jgi:hypothetical protein
VKRIWQAYSFATGNKYTNEFPDLTDAGKETIKRAAVEIRKIHNLRPDPLRIMSSPAPRALGTAAIISQIMGYDQRVIRTSLLSPADVRDARRGAEIFNEHVGNGDSPVVGLLWIDQRTRSRILNRELRCLQILRSSGQLVRNLMAGSRPLFWCGVSHYEVLYTRWRPRSPGLRKDHPLIFGEMALLSFYDIGPGSTVEVCLTFRDRSRNMVFDYKKNLVAQ